MAADARQRLLHRCGGSGDETREIVEQRQLLDFLLERLLGRLDARRECLDLAALVLAAGARVEHLAQRGADLGDAERLGEVVRDAAAQRVHGRLGRRERRHDERVEIGLDLLGLLDQVHAIDLRHAQIGDEQVVAVLAHAIERDAPIGHVVGGVALRAEDPGEQLSDAFFVVDDENADGLNRRYHLGLDRSSVPDQPDAPSVLSAAAGFTGSRIPRKKRVP